MNQWVRSYFRSGRRAAWVAGGIAAYLVAVRCVAEPLHARGHAQAVLGVLNATGFLLGFPGTIVAGMLSHRAIEHIGRAQFALALSINVMLYFVALCGVDRFGRKRSRDIADAGTGAGVTRREFFRKTADLAAGGALAGGFGYSIVWEPGELRVTHRSFPIRDLPESLDRLRVLQFSDLHHGPWLGLDHVRDVVRRANALRPDVILLTGDYISDSPRYIEPAVEALSALRANVGIVGVLGNHDWWDHGRPMKAAFARHGLPLIDNDRLFITPDRMIVGRATEGVCLAGVGDLWEDAQDFRAALGGLPESMPRLLLSHNPDTAEEPGFLLAHARVDLMISGHTHGGQVWVPGLGTPILPSKFGQKYAAGLVQGPQCPVFISRGIGVSGLPVRFGVPPELVMMELRRAVP